MKDQRYLEFQATLGKESAGLASVIGYDRLKPLLKGATDWDKFQEVFAQINITLWFKQNSLLKEIEPTLPHRQVSCDLLLSFSQQDIYCEVSSFQSFVKSIESREQGTDDERIKIKLQQRPYLTKQDIEHEIKNDRIIRNLLIKTKKQLPPKHPGILALETGKSMVFHFDIKEIAQELFPSRPQVMLIMLWSLERGSEIGEAPFWFVNPSSPFQDIGQKLLEHFK